MQRRTVPVPAALGQRRAMGANSHGPRIRGARPFQSPSIVYKSLPASFYCVNESFYRPHVLLASRGRRVVVRVQRRAVPLSPARGQRRAVGALAHGPRIRGARPFQSPSIVYTSLPASFYCVNVLLLCIQRPSILYSVRLASRGGRVVGRVQRRAVPVPAALGGRRAVGALAHGPRIRGYYAPINCYYDSVSNRPWTCMAAWWQERTVRESQVLPP